MKGKMFFLYRVLPIVLAMPLILAAQNYDFNDGTKQGWTMQGAYDENMNGPYSSNFTMAWTKVANYTVPDASSTKGSLLVYTSGGLGITGSSGSYWILKLTSPDLSSKSSWQSATGFSVQIVDNMTVSSSLYANLIVTVYDKNQAKNRTFYNGQLLNQKLTHSDYINANATWNKLTFDWSKASNFPTNYTVKSVTIQLMGTMSGLYEGQAIVDEVDVISGGGGGGSGASITVTAPNGGEKWAAGSQQNVTWTGQGIDNYDVKIEYSTNNGSSYSFIVWTTNHGTSGSYAWTVPNEPSAQCLVKLSVQQATVISDVSNAVFSITQPTQPSVFTGHVYRGNKPDATNPVSGVTVELYGDSDEWPTSGPKTLLASTTTNASGEFTLTLGAGSFTYNYYHVEETDPSGVNSVGAQAPSPGYVKNYNVVSFQGSTLTPGTTYDKIAFWDVSSGGGGGGGTGAAENIVTNTSGFDSGSLGAAIAYANTHPGVDTIRFNIPKSDPGFNSATGVWTIAPNNSFQGIVESGVVIDGFSQRDFIGEDTNPEGPEIQLIGTNAGTNIDGLYIHAPRAEIFGLTIGGYRIGIAMLWVSGGRISGCYLGTNAKGDKATANQYGIWLGHQTQNVLIIPAEWQPNLISGNTEAGICISDTSFHNTVRGNIIGMNRAEHAAIPNGTFGGILIQNDSYENEVAENHISGNNHGVFLYQKAHHNMITDNWIGTDPSWNLDLGNTLNGVSIDEGASDNQVRQNFIGRNHGFGIRVNGSNSVRNRLTHNAISLNTQGGIRNDDGGNMNFQAPGITNASPAAVEGTAAPNATVEIYTDQGDQGAMFQGETTADGSGHFVWNGSLTGPFNNVTAIAIDPQGNTSPFSQSAVTAVEKIGASGVPDAFLLSQNYPNPFNPVTAICYTIPKAGPVRLTVCDMRGRVVAVLKDGMEAAGTNTIHFDASQLTSGIYVYRIETAGGMLSKKLVLMK